jgi:hypothetical protein
VTSVVHDYGIMLENQTPSCARHAKTPFIVFGVHMKPLIEAPNILYHISLNKNGSAREHSDPPSSQMIPMPPQE